MTEYEIRSWRIPNYEIHSANPMTPEDVGLLIYRNYNGPIGRKNREEGKSAAVLFDEPTETHMVFYGNSRYGTQAFNVKAKGKSGEEAKLPAQEFVVQPINVKKADFARAINQVNAALRGN